MSRCYSPTWLFSVSRRDPARQNFRGFERGTPFRDVTGRLDQAVADAILRGTILTQTVTPLTYNSQTGQSSSYLITITASAVLTDGAGKVMYSNDHFRFHSQYQETADLSSFIQEDSPAVQRMARDFADSLVSDLMESF